MGKDWRVSVATELGVQLSDWRRLGGGDFAQSWQATVLASGNDDSGRSRSDQPLVDFSVSSNPAHERRSVQDDCDSPLRGGLVDAKLSASERDQFLQAGCSVFIKTHSHPPPNHFSTEARGLSWMRETASVNVPAVLAVSDDPPYLALQWIDEGRRTGKAESLFGRELASLHRASCSHFGRLDGRTTGSLGLPNRACLSWAEFYGTQRLQPLARIARQRRALPDSCIRQIEHLSERLSEFSDFEESPARLHGDLWAGNRLVDRAGFNWLIDPACHGGHREFDLAMMRLFGGYDEECFSSYNEVHPLADGWRERIALHQLAPLIVHAIKFGDTYVPPTKAALEQYV